jgi:hypothetical protein
MTISCVITGVKYEDFSVELTHKSSQLRQREKALVRSFLALLVQKYKYCLAEGATGARQEREEARVYLLYWYKGTNTDAEGAAGALGQEREEARGQDQVRVRRNIHHPYFACFTGTHVQILTQKALLGSCAATFTTHASRTCRALPLVQKYKY